VVVALDILSKGAAVTLLGIQNDCGGLALYRLCSTDRIADCTGIMPVNIDDLVKF